MPLPATPLVIHIEGRTWPFTTVEDASRKYRSVIDRLGLGASETPPCEILAHGPDGMIPVGDISYNGKVWELGPENPDGTFDVVACLYDPYSNPDNPSVEDRSAAPPSWKKRLR